MYVLLYIFVGRLSTAGGNGVVTLHAMHSVVDWFAYAMWTNGKLVRSLSLSPGSGIPEDIGQRLPFEEPYWSGEFPALDSEEEKDAYRLPQKARKLIDRDDRGSASSRISGISGGLAIVCADIESAHAMPIATNGRPS